MSLPIGNVNDKTSVLLTPTLQRIAYQPFIGPGPGPQGWHYCSDPIPNNTLCFFCVDNSGLAAGINFMSKAQTVLQCMYERRETEYTVNVSTYDSSLGVYTASVSWGGNAGNIDPMTQIDIAAFRNLTSAMLQEFAEELIGHTASDTPYEGPPSDVNGGYASGTSYYDSVPFPDVPALSAVSTGFASIWVPTSSEVRALATYMWNTDILTVDWWKKLVADPLDLILGFYIFPITLTPDGTESVTLGDVDTGVEMHYISDQYVDVDCGTIELAEYWKAYIDYSPYTKLSIFLPYIGVRPLDIDDVMSRSLTLKYRVDLVSGACVAMIRVDGGSVERDRQAVLYQFSGVCATQIPVTSIQMGDILRASVTLGTSIAAMATGAGALSGALGVAASAANLATTKPDIAHSGAIGSAAGLMGIQRPYLIIERPRAAIPKEQQAYTGYPSFIAESLDELAGYTEVEVTHLHNMTATQPEVDEIVQLLREGVFF